MNIIIVDVNYEKKSIKSKLSKENQKKCFELI